jgi:uncharacterized protein (UPF0261 family)
MLKPMEKNAFYNGIRYRKGADGYLLSCRGSSAGSGGEAMAVMASGAAKVVRDLYGRGLIQGILGMGGTAGTAVGSCAMRALPIGFPKLIVSTVASGDTRGYVGTKDIVLYHAIVDVAGVNRISREYLRALQELFAVWSSRTLPIKLAYENTDLAAMC